jgi:outer membrane receptor protein involved in Fe transport
MYKRVTITILLVLFVTAGLFAASTGKIRGVVKDRETKEPLPGANVIVTGTQMGAATDINGEFIILNVPVGLYSLRTSFVGYRSVVVSNVKISVDLTTNINIDMPSEALEGQEVTIVAERPLVDKNETHEIHSIRTEEMQNLPIRGTAAALNIMPGVVDDDGIHIRGGRTGEMAYYVDGVNVTMGNGDNGLTVIHNSIEEISYHAGGFGAEFGTKMSGQMFTTIKSGTSDYKFGGEVISDDFWAIKSDKEGYRILGLPETYSYGYDDYVMYASGPVPGLKNLKFYAAGQTYWRGTNATWFDGFKESNDAFAYASYSEHGVVTRDTVRLGMDIAPGRYPGGGTAGWTINSNLLWDLKALRVKLGGTYNGQRDQGGADEPTEFLVVPVRTRLNKRQNYSAYLNVTHTVNPTMFYTLNLNMFHNGQETGDPVMGWDRSEWRKWGDPVYNSALADTSVVKTLTAPGSFTFSMPGTPVDTYTKGSTDLLGGKLDVTKQVGTKHELKLGGEVNYYTLRSYSVTARNYLTREATAAAVAGTPNYMTDWDFYSGIGAVFIGYDIFGEKKVSKDEFYTSNVGGKEISLNAHNKPAHPLISGAYIQDRIELKDMIINAGLRLDYIDNGVPGYKDLRSLTMATGQVIDESNFTASKKYTYLSPRLGFSFPVTDKIVFHAQYGKYVQPPPMNNAGFYNTRGYQSFAQLLYGGGYAANFANPNLKPERQTTYEFGFKQEFGGIASIDATAFYKDTRDLTTLRVIFPLITDYRAPYFHMNADFGTVKGLSLTFNLRRTNRFLVSANYTYSDAKGTGSAANSHFDIAWQEQSPTFPSIIGPLDFDQRHKGYVDVDFRFGKDDSPTIFGMKPLSRFGVNMAYNFHSGTPYTLVAADYGSESNFTFNAPAPLEGYNASSIGWFAQMDLKVDKAFSIGPLDMNVYLWVQNLLNTKSQTNLWRATGRADDDGWLATEAGQAYAQQYGETGVRWYKAMMTNTGTYGWQAPRVIRAGLKFDL